MQALSTPLSSNVFLRDSKFAREEQHWKQTMLAIASQMSSATKKEREKKYLRSRVESLEEENRRLRRRIEELEELEEEKKKK